MTDLKKLDVSLTKHGSHKIAILLRKYDKDNVLKHVRDSEPNINIALSQAKKILSAGRQGRVPDLWDKARQNGDETIDALVLIAIILSHRALITAITNSSDRHRFTGAIKRSQFRIDKEFTNIRGSIDELGYSIERTKDYFR